MFHAEEDRYQKGSAVPGCPGACIALYRSAMPSKTRRCVASYINVVAIRVSASEAPESMIVSSTSEITPMEATASCTAPSKVARPSVRGDSNRAWTGRHMPSPGRSLASPFVQKIALVIDFYLDTHVAIGELDARTRDFLAHEAMSHLQGVGPWRDRIDLALGLARVGEHAPAHLKGAFGRAIARIHLHAQRLRPAIALPVVEEGGIEGALRVPERAVGHLLERGLHRRIIHVIMCVCAHE